jgi:excisionase family DNA binding protein
MDNATGGKKTQEVEPLSFSIEQFAKATNIGRNKAYGAIARGELRSFKDGKRRLISVEAAKEYIRRRELETAEGLAATTKTPRSPGRPRKAAKAA